MGDDNGAVFWFIIILTTIFTTIIVGVSGCIRDQSYLKRQVESELRFFIGQQVWQCKQLEVKSNE